MKRVVLLFVLLFAIGALGQQSSNDNYIQEQEQSAVNLLRVINTAEWNFHSQNGQFADFQHLAAAGLLNQETLKIPDTMWPKGFHAANAREPVPGLVLTLYLAADGSGYQVAVMPGSRGPEFWGFYSTQDGIIYKMRAIR